MQESVKKFAPFFSDLVLNAQFPEQINDRYSKNWAPTSWLLVQLVRQLRHLLVCKKYANSNFTTDYLRELLIVYLVLGGYKK